MPSSKYVVRLAVQEASAIEWKSGRITKVHEDAVKGHLRAMGPDRAEAVADELRTIHWDSLKLHRRVPTRRIGREELGELKRKIARNRNGRRRGKDV